MQKQRTFFPVRFSGEWNRAIMEQPIPWTGNHYPRHAGQALTKAAGPEIPGGTGRC